MEKNVSKARFIVPSVVGIFLFMIPIKVDGSWTIAVKIIADWISAIAESILPGLCLFILTVSAVLCLMAFAKPKFIMENTLLKEAFCCTPFWAATRVLGCIFCWLAYFNLGNEQGRGFSKFIGAITGPDQGGMALGLIVGLVIIFLIASFLLPLLLDFGLLEFVGALLTKFMRPLFQVPGRAAVDCITSWIGDGTLGVMLTCNQYEGGYYSTKEASIISTCFSAVSITFSMVVLAQVDLTQYFGIYYLIICLIGIVCAVICPRIYPLRKKPNDYLIPGKAMPETLPEGFTSSKEYGLHLAMKRAAAHKGVGEFFRNGAKKLPEHVVRRPANRYVHRYRSPCGGQLHSGLRLAGHAVPSASQRPAGAGCRCGGFHHGGRLHRYVHPIGNHRRHQCGSNDSVHRCGGFRNPGTFLGRSRRTDSQLQAADQPVRTVPHLPGANHYFPGNRLPDCPSVVLISEILN